MSGLKKLLMSSGQLPVLQTQQDRRQSDAPSNSAQLGFAVAISDDGNTVIGGEHQNGNGRVQIYVRSGTTWSTQTSIGGPASGLFGCAVALSSNGNTAIVGARQTGASPSQAGAAYVYTRSGSTWSLQATLTASDAAADDNFGVAVALSDDGNTAIIGADLDDDFGSSSGSAYVFTRSGSTWSQQQKINASNASANAQFGGFVALSADGNTALVGAEGGAKTLGSGSGTAYAFTRSGSTWTQQQIVQSAQNTAAFGIYLNLSSDGNTAVIGSLDTISGASQAGAAYVFTRSAGVWTERAQLTASDFAANDQFGVSVDISGDGSRIIVGASGDDNSLGVNAGSYYVFEGGGASWGQTARVQALTGGAANAVFGRTVAMADDGLTAAIGSPGSTVSGNTSAGYVYIFI